MDEGLHRTARDPAREIPALLRHSKCHPPCEEYRLSFEDETHLEEIPLALRAGSTWGLYLGKGPYEQQRIRCANEGATSREAEHVPTKSQTREVPPSRSELASTENQFPKNCQINNCLIIDSVISRIGRSRLRAIFVNSLNVPSVGYICK